ncbi:MAG TPA: nucleotidyltransferase family protein [Gemmatimonadaceae bacterium]|nr:nucleotidyltransferase family protein [Gemmatimonadaceae bacterium]
MVRSIAPYDLMVAVLGGSLPPQGVVAGACAASPGFWQRALTLEACPVQLDRALRGTVTERAFPAAVRRMLSDATARALRQALTVPAQLDELAGAASELGIQVLVLKGAARILQGAPPAARSMSDIDVLTSPADAGRLHHYLQRRLGYVSLAAAPEHHLPTLMRAGALPVEVHVQLGPSPTDLDARIWRDARAAVERGLLLPSPTATLLHALEHGALVHWAVRYRLRDLLDVAEAWNEHVEQGEVDGYVRRHPQRVALATMLEGARRFSPGIPAGRPSAWRTIRRVARVRHVLAAHIPDPGRAKSLCIAGGVLAEGSPRALLRPAQLALFGVKQARAEVLTSPRGQSSTT